MPRRGRGQARGRSQKNSLMKPLRCVFCVPRLRFIRMRVIRLVRSLHAFIGS